MTIKEKKKIKKTQQLESSLQAIVSEELDNIPQTTLDSTNK